jgi:N6-adenosine-specific RNA methylase IME4
MSRCVHVQGAKYKPKTSTPYTTMHDNTLQDIPITAVQATECMYT